MKDVAWFRPDGDEMSEQDWNEWFAKSFMLFLNGDALRARDERGRPVCDATFLLLFNAHVDPVSFTLPGSPWGQRWVPVMDTALVHGFHEQTKEVPSGTSVDLSGLSLQVLQRR